MQLGFVGLGKMGFNMVLNLLEKEHDIVAYDINKQAVQEVRKRGAQGVLSLPALVRKLEKPRVIWMMIPHQFMEGAFTKLLKLLEPGDVVIDGGNSYFKESKKRAALAKEQGIVFMDVGVSGGVVGARQGACMMVGGPKITFSKLELLFHDMCQKDGYTYCGTSGAGHFVKMVHNGIEYGVMQAYAEGFELLKENCHYAGLDTYSIAKAWNHGSIIESFLLKKIESAFHKSKNLKGIQGEVADSGEGRWTIHTAVECGVNTPVIAHALFARFRSQEKNAFADRLLAAVRHEFGGHALKRKHGKNL